MIRHTFLKLVCLALAAFVAASSLAWALDDPIQTKNGKVSGAALDSGIRTYKGIPFAAPPVGNLRWKAPQPVANWDGVRAADKFGATAMQGRGQTAATGTGPGMSEDCLFLNVWTPAKAATDSLPVMVWIHGGGWTSGSGSAATYNMESFAKKGIVGVTINYRMGTLGFLAHPLLSKESERGVSGNYGILDMIAALHWVQDNIANFGGNPKNVTIFGESAGGSSVYVLVASPLAKGLFQKAISESAWVTESNMTDLKKKTPWGDSAEAIGERATQEALAGQSGDPLAALRALPAAEALRLRTGVSAAVDGWLLPKSPAEIYGKGEQNQVPVIVGTNSSEGMMFAGRGSMDSIEALRDARKKQYGDSSEDIWKYYGATAPDGIRKAQIDHGSDTMFIRPSRDMARGMARTGNKTFMYHFTRNPRNPADGANHAAELPYVFMRVAADSSNADRKLSDYMNSYWANFAKNGDPNGAGLPVWPAFDLASEQYQELNDPIKPGTFLRKDALDSLDRFIEVKNKASVKP